MPLPLLIGAVAVAGVIYTVVKKDGECVSCKAEFRGITKWKHECPGCHEIFCSDCLKQTEGTPLIPASVLSRPAQMLCRSCEEKAKADLEKYTAAVLAASNIEVFPSTFKGKTGANLAERTLRLESDWKKSQLAAEEQLRVACSYLGFNLVVERIYEKQETEGSYVQSEWKAVGTLALKQDG